MRGKRATDSFVQRLGSGVSGWEMTDSWCSVTVERHQEAERSASAAPLAALWSETSGEKRLLSKSRPGHRPR
jgi:hypothetical protein